MSVSGCSASVYFNPQGSREPRLKFADIPRLPSDFNPQGSREPRLSSFSVLRLRNPISIHKALASLDHEGIRKGLDIAISIHKALASLDFHQQQPVPKKAISIHKALASLDFKVICSLFSSRYFNPQGSREPRLSKMVEKSSSRYFNPQGSREPRPLARLTVGKAVQFQSTRLSRASTVTLYTNYDFIAISIHKALASLDGNG